MVEIRKIPIAVMAILFLSIVSLILLSLFGLFWYQNYKDLKWQQLKAINLNLAEQAAIKLSGYLWNYDFVQIEKTVENLLKEPSVYSVTIKQNNPSKVVAKVTRDQSWNKLKNQEQFNDYELIYVEKSVFYNQSEIGTIEVSLTTKYLEKELNQILFLTFMGIFLIVGLIILLFYFSFWKWVVKPLKLLKQYSIDVILYEKNADTIEDFSFYGELENLKNSLSTMVHLLEQRYKQLQVESRKTIERENQLKTIIQTIPDLIWVKDPRGAYLFCNEKFEQLFGEKQENIIGKTDYDFVTKEDADLFREHDLKVVDTGLISIKEEWLQFKTDSKKLYFETIKVPLYNMDKYLIGILGIARDITQRYDAEKRISHLLKEKEALFNEIYYRTKNTMQMINDMIYLQADEFPDHAELQKIARETEMRVIAISLVLDVLYRSQDLSRISPKEFILNLCQGLMERYKKNKIDLKIQVELEEIPLDIAIPLCLILNELISNSLEHAFINTENGKIWIDLRKNQSNLLIFQYSDNGENLPKDFNFEKNRSIGLKMVYLLGENQLDGKIHMEVKNGFFCTIEFPENLYSQTI